MAEAFEIIGAFRDVAIIAAGKSVRSRSKLIRQYGTGRWRKMKGICLVQYSGGRICTAEVHWYEAHGRGRFDFKIKEELS